jgi:hypothetical protein
VAENEQAADFTVYLEGHEGHRGNVLLHAFISKVHRIELVLNKLERAFIAVGTRRTEFEIVGADKRNPTTLTLKPVPRIKAYNPTPAFQWGMRQIATVARGEMPDARVNADIANDLVKLATPEGDDGFKAFWINGHSEQVRFDEEFLAHATRVAKQRTREEAPRDRWHTGASIGSIVGELRAVDDIEGERQFVIVPPAGADAITCTFPEAMRAEIGNYLFKLVRVTGILHYGDASPFPFKVEARESGIENYPPRIRRRSLSELRGVFAGKERLRPDWDSLLNGR